MNFKALQKKSKKTEQQDEAVSVKQKDGSTKMVHKYKRKKRYGHSIKNRSPGLMQADLKTKATQYGIHTTKSIFINIVLLNFTMIQENTSSLL